MNSKVSLYQGDIVKIRGDAIVNGTSETIIREVLMQLFMKLQGQDCYGNVRN